MQSLRARSGGLVAVVLVAVAAVASTAADRSDRGVAPERRQAPATLRLVRLAQGTGARAVAELEARGMRIMGHLGGGALLAAFPQGSTPPPPAVATLEAWSAERAVAPILARLDARAAARMTGGVPVLVGLAPGADPAPAGALLNAAGAEVSWTDSTSTLPQLGVRVPAAHLDEVLAALRRLDDLAWADLQPPVRLRNAASAWRCQSGMSGATPIFDHGLYGEGQVIAVMDTGIDIDHCQFEDPVHGLPALNDDVTTTVDPGHRKVLAVDFYWSRDWPVAGPESWDDQGHGSHVAGSVAGDEGANGLYDGYDGMAPAAKLVIQDGGFTTDPCADLPGLGCPVRPLEPVLAQAYAQGARIHSDSWGDEEDVEPFNRYTERTADIDRFIWHHPDFLVLVAGGNAGPGDNTIGSPATGKNVVGVGATVHGDQEPPCVAVFSSRGWTQDGRVKPDVVAPGASVISAASDRAIDTFNCGVRALSGTSMATPTAAGLTALVRQYYVDGYYPAGRPLPGSGFTPSAALLKATLIASAVDLTSLGCTGIEPIPSRDQGWGLIQLDRALTFPGDERGLWVDDEPNGFATDLDPVVTRRLRLSASGPLKAVLVWTDPPSSSAAASNLVNDLDLEVEGPDGTFAGNAFAGGVSVSGGMADRTNNVEVVWLPAAAAGEWTITVAAHRVIQGPQPWALVVTGAVVAPAPAPRRGGIRRVPGG